MLILIDNDKIHDNKGNNIINQTKNHTNLPFNITNKYNNSINITNNGDISYNFFNNIICRSQLENISIKYKKIFHLAEYIYTIIFISFLSFYLYKLIHKWDKINDTLYKITSYLLLCESKENNKFFYYLMKDFSILVTKKKYYYENKKLLPILPPKNQYLSDKNIILYCINIINKSEKFIIINNYELISNSDFNDIKVLTIYIEQNLGEQLLIYDYKISHPIRISIIIAIIYFRPEYELLFFLLLFMLIIISKFIKNGYIQANNFYTDNFIDAYNDLLINKNRFIYRKDNLIMYFALKDNNYTKKQIINFIEKIIN